MDKLSVVSSQTEELAEVRDVIWNGPFTDHPDLFGVCSYHLSADDVTQNDALLSYQVAFLCVQI